MIRWGSIKKRSRHESKSIKCTQLARDHYLRGPENERIELLQVRGFATQDPDEVIEMIILSAKGTKCKKPVYSVKLNPESDRPFTRKEAYKAIGMLESNLGLDGHARVVVEHEKNGRVHYHVLWSRFHPDGGPAKNMSNDYAVHKKTQKQIEAEFKLRPMMAKGRDFKVSDVEWAKRYGFDIFKLRDQITADFRTVRSGAEFKVALEERGIVLCRGDKSQFVVILPWSQHKALSSMIMGRPTKAVLRRALADIDISTLPTVAEGKAIVKARLPIKVHKGAAGQDRAKYQAALKDLMAGPSIDGQEVGVGARSGKTDKGEGAGGGANTGMSALKMMLAPELFAELSNDKAQTINTGPQRRRRNLWVPVERRGRGPS